MSNLIDLDSSPNKLNVSFPLTLPLIPSPTCLSSQSLRVSSDLPLTDDNNNTPENSSICIEKVESSPENNPFDVVMRRVTEYQQNQDDPYERILESSKSLVSRLFDSPKKVKSEGDNMLLFEDSELRLAACDETNELISSIEINFDELPLSDDDENVECTNENLIELTASPSDVSTRNKSIIKKNEDKLKNNNEINKIEKELVEQLDCSKKSTAATLLLSLKNLIRNENNVQANKALEDVGKALGLNLDNNIEILKVCLECKDDGVDDDDNDGKEEDKLKRKTKLLENTNNSCNDKSLKKCRTDKSDRLKSTVHLTESKSEVKLSNQSGRKSNVKPTNEQVKKLPTPKSSIVKLSTGAIKKSPSLRLSNKPAETQSLKRSVSISQKLNISSSNNIGIGTKPLQRAKPVDSKAQPKVVTNETKASAAEDSSSRRSRLGTYTISPSSVTRSRNDVSTTNCRVTRSQSALQTSKSSAMGKELKNFALRRTSTTLNDKSKPTNLKTKSSCKINDTFTLQKNQTSTIKTRASLAGLKSDCENLTRTSKATSVSKEVQSKSQGRLALSPLDNFNKITNNPTSTVFNKIITFKNKTLKRVN